MDELTPDVGPDECPAYSRVTGGGGDEGEPGFLVCGLPPGHPGLHYDTEDDITWKNGTWDD